MKRNKVNYHEYIKSDAWRGRHSKWLKSFGYCAALPWLVLGKNPDGTYRAYNMHHTHYKTLGRERLWLDVVPLSIFAHDKIVHGILSGYKKPSEQKHYPNLPQQLFHAWCRLIMALNLWWWAILPVMIGVVWKAHQSNFHWR